MRGRAPVEAYFTDALPRLSEIRSTIEQAEVSHWGEVEVETFVLHQRYVYDGTPVQLGSGHEPRKMQSVAEQTDVVQHVTAQGH